MNSLFRYILGHLSVLSDDDLAELDFESAKRIISNLDIDAYDREKITKLFKTIQEELGLQHHGILGMKWGVRRYQNEDGSLTTAGQKRYRAMPNQEKKSIFDHAESFQIKTRTGETINADPVEPWPIGKKILNGLFGIQEKDELGRRGDANYTLSDSKGNKIGELSLISRSSDVAYLDWITIDEKQRGKGYATDIITNVLTKANDFGYSKVELNALEKPRPLYERLGFVYSDTSKMSIIDRINRFEFGCKHMEYDLTKLRHTNETYLAHHGILGMKWGVRRYQNPDGTLTETGKKRIYTNAKIASNRGQYIRSLGKEIKKSDNNLGRTIEDVGYAIEGRSKEYLRYRDRDIAKKAKTMSDEELRKSVARMNLERQYRSLRKEDMEAGSNFVYRESRESVKDLIAYSAPIVTAAIAPIISAKITAVIAKK